MNFKRTNLSHSVSDSEIEKSMADIALDDKLDHEMSSAYDSAEENYYHYEARHHKKHAVSNQAMN